MRASLSLYPLVYEAFCRACDWCWMPRSVFSGPHAVARRHRRRRRVVRRRRRSVAVSGGGSVRRKRAAASRGGIGAAASGGGTVWRHRMPAVVCARTVVPASVHVPEPSASTRAGSHAGSSSASSRFWTSERKLVCCVTNDNGRNQVDSVHNLTLGRGTGSNTGRACGRARSWSRSGSRNTTL